jgi:hypothetical protein
MPQDFSPEGVSPDGLGIGDGDAARGFAGLPSLLQTWRP